MACAQGQIYLYLYFRILTQVKFFCLRVYLCASILRTCAPLILYVYERLNVNDISLFLSTVFV